MVIETIPIQGLWKLIRFLPGFALRWYFTPEKLAKLIYIDIRPRHDSAVVNLGQTATFTLYLQAINLSPFSVELDRASFRFWFGGVTLNASILKKQVIAPGEIADLYLNEAIPDGHANQMAKQIEGNRVALDGNIEFNCKVRSFAKTLGHLDGINAKVYNAHVRANA
ncbi:MAG: Uncharacterized protein AWT59_1371 [Candidatus Gallionella acididurans]|uniref:Uncharacterized protein n=1 Tax=Candidatus Gallionella acididurans TaxID=1796491 RepID=A0A139BUF4_9PROT|nr:MAG: Uncharacterized protein AWT59_1371 [Candidatus Gallionella acididurans]